MSLENALAANTAAVQAQTAALLALTEAWNALRDTATDLKAKGHNPATLVSAGVPQAETPKVEEPKPEEAKAPKAAKPAKTPEPAPTPAVTEPAQPEAAEAEPVTESPSEVAVTSLEDVQNLIRANTSRHREAIVATLVEFGAKRASELKAEDYAGFVAALTAKVAA